MVWSLCVKLWFGPGSTHSHTHWKHGGEGLQTLWWSHLYRHEVSCNRHHAPVSEQSGVDGHLVTRTEQQGYHVVNFTLDLYWTLDINTHILYMEKLDKNQWKQIFTPLDLRDYKYTINNIIVIFYYSNIKLLNTDSLNMKSLGAGDMSQWLRV